MLVSFRSHTCVWLRPVYMEKQLHGASSVFWTHWWWRWWWWFFDWRRYILWIYDDIFPRYYCCALSRDPYFCDLYAEKRPPGDCGGYIPPIWGWMIGDPHFTTLDGVSYTFNGFGEYTLATVDNGFFRLQGRTAKALDEDGNPVDHATVFIAFAAKESSSSTQARTNCGDNQECLFDTLATGREDIGILTKNTTTQIGSQVSDLANFPPNITGEGLIEAEVGKQIIVELNATDPNGDDVVYDLLETIPGGQIYQNGSFVWTPENTVKVNLSFIASDGSASSALNPIVKLCECKNNGTCNYNTTVQGSDINNDKFAMLNKLSLFEDFDECSEGHADDNSATFCEQGCENTLLSYLCRCYEGYRLNEDKKSCDGEFNK
uniref:Mucin-4-like n=1 Tax=Saccoglossus kowalevskii TaxID=10224 RepID=A0ABM0M1G6_SACKO|nr:PREDICTED: mucin-4-like [Saccoglossus kowalevskii]